MGETSIRSTVIAGQTEGLMVGCGWVGGFMVDLWRKGPLTPISPNRLPQLSTTMRLRAGAKQSLRTRGRSNRHQNAAPNPRSAGLWTEQSRPDKFSKVSAQVTKLIIWRTCENRGLHQLRHYIVHAVGIIGG